MAFANVAGRQPSSEDSNKTSHTVLLPGSIAAGDLLIAVFTYSVTANTITWPGGWTAIPNGAKEETGGSSQGIATAYRQADGSEGGSITVGTSGTCRSASVVLRITDHENPATQAPEAASTNGLNGPANPPSLTITGGPKDILWIACGGNSHSSIYTTAPANYSNLQQDQGDGGGTAGAYSNVGTAERQLNASTEDPGAFAGSDAVSEWCGVTIAIHPSSGAPPAGQPTMARWRGIPGMKLGNRKGW
jgi:hypothetical protein